jgi:hypothetical protein
MPVFKVTAPDGAVIEVNAPEGATEAQAIQYAQQQYNPSAKQAIVADPLVSETNKAAIDRIAQAIPDPVKEVAGKIGSIFKSGYNALPEDVQKAGKTTGNFLLDSIEILSRPFQATATYLKAIGQTPEFKSGAPVWDILSDKNLRDAQQAGIRGLRGEEKASFQEALPEEFRRNNPVKSMLLGFMGDVVIDPLKGGTVAPFFSTVKSAAKTVDGSIGITSRLADNELFRAFNINTGDVAKAQELFNNYRYLKDKARIEGVQNAKALDNQIKALSKQTGVPVNELKAKIVQDIETGNMSDDVIGAIESKIVARNRELLEQQRAAGVDIGDLGETYMPHVLTKEADELLKGEGTKNFFGLRPSAKTPQAISREIEGTVKEINSKNLYGTAKFFQDDPAILAGYAEFNAAQAIAGRKFLDDAAQLGVRAEVAPASYTTVPEIPGIKFPQEVAARLNRSYQVLTSNEEINKFLKVYDGAQNWWKMWSLGARPAYHAKNTIGNLWNNYLAGVTTPKPYADAAAFQVKLAKNNMNGSIAGYKTDELYNAMATRGVFGEGQYSGDITRTVEDVLKGGSSNPFTLSTRNPILRGGFKIGQTIEDNARIALFIDSLNKGKNFDEAASQVRKYLFDYGDLSPFERSTLKRLMPFYTWSRKNLPLQLEAIVRHPDKVNKLNLARENIQFETEVPDLEDVPSYIREALPIYGAEKFLGEPALPGTAKAITLANLIPFADLATFTKWLDTETTPEKIEKGKLSSTISTALGGVSPLLKAPVEYLSNYDFFRRKTIEEFKGQTADMLGMKMPVHLAKALSNIVMLNEIDRANPGGVFGTRSVDPVTKEVVTIPGILGFTPRETRVDLPEEQREAQYLTGIRIYDVIFDDVGAQQAQTIKKDIAALKGFIKRAAVKEKTREVYDAEAALEKYSAELDRIEAARETRRKKEKQ